MVFFVARTHAVNGVLLSTCKVILWQAPRMRRLKKARLWFVDLKVNCYQLNEEAITPYVTLEALRLEMNAKECVSSQTLDFTS